MAKNRKIVGVIPARWGSTRFPGKSLHPIKGRPLIQWVVEAAQRATCLSDIVVATDDERIAAAVAAMGCRVAMTESDLPTGTDRVAAAMGGEETGIVINLQGDEPLVPGELIDELGRRMVEDETVEMATAAVPIRELAELESPNVVKVVMDAADVALYFSRLPIPARRDGAPDMDAGLYWRHLGIYAYRSDFLKRVVATPPCALEQTEMLEQLRAMYIGARIAIVKCESIGIGVDTPEDVALLEREFDRLGYGNQD